jgi:DNA damage-inducible protein 1
LPEHQIPKMMEEALENEPKVAGPGGTTIGTESGTVAGPADSQSSAQQATQPSSSTAQPTSVGTTTSQPATATATQQAPARPQGQLGFGQNQDITEESIATVMQFGVSRDEAVRLLEQAGGNPDIAVGLLF